MDDVKIMIQDTPNPNALKFVLNTTVRTKGNVTYKKGKSIEKNPLAREIFHLHHAISEVYFFDNYITVTQDGTTPWSNLGEEVKATILELIKTHDPNFEDETAKPAVTSLSAAGDDPDIAKINSILDETVRPALQMDGGDLQVVNYKDNKVYIFYQGACGSCPSSTMGTLQAIENILKDQFNPDVSVQLA